ncbi:hypothetical protein RRG08_005504, partial [Elysia crispata]
MASRRLFILYLLLTSLAQKCCHSQRSFHFKLSLGQKITSGATEVKQRSGPITQIRCAAFCGLDCGMFHYSTVHEICVVFVERYFDAGPVFTSDADWTIGLKQYSVVTKEGWSLVFRGQSEIAVPVWDVWSNTGVHHDSPIPSDFPHACLRMEQYTSCDRHFRSHILDNWANIKQ